MACLKLFEWEGLTEVGHLVVVTAWEVEEIWDHCEGGWNLYLYQVVE